MLFLVFIAVVGPLDWILPQFGLTPPGRGTFRVMPTITLDMMRQGEATPLIEERWRRMSFVVHGTGSLYNELMYLAFGRLVNFAVLRPGGWIFSQQNLAQRSDDQVRAALAVAVDDIRHILKPFQDAAVPVVVNFIPDREVVYRDFAEPAGKLPATGLNFTRELTARLNELDILSISYFTALMDARARGAQVFFRDDHHWTYEGARVAAVATADVLRRNALAPTEAEAIYDVAPGERHGSPGSLLFNLDFLSGGRTESRFSDRANSIKPKFTPRRAIEPGNVWVLDTSFGVFNYTEFLANEIGEPVESLLGSGRGSLYSAQAFVAQVLNNPARPKPRLVVWNLAEYHLSGVTTPNRFAMPAYSREIEPEIGFEIKPIAGVSMVQSRVLETTTTRGSFVVRTARPVQRLQVFLRTGSYGDNTIALAGQVPLTLIDGSTRYDFTMSEPTDRFELHFMLGRAGTAIEFEKAAGR